MNQAAVVDPLEGSCCLACKTELILEPAALRVMLSTGITISKIASWLGFAETNMLREAVGEDRWGQIQALAGEAMIANLNGRNIRTLHDRFGQAKIVTLYKPYHSKIYGNLELRSSLEIIVRQNQHQQLSTLINLMAEEVVEPHLALRTYRGLNLGTVLESALIFDLYEETVTVVYPTTYQGVSTKEFKLPGQGRDLNALKRRVGWFLTNGVGRWRAVFIKNIWGLGRPDQANNGVPLAREWIQEIKQNQANSWIVLGLIVPDDARFRNMNADNLNQMINLQNNYRHVKILDMRVAPRRSYRIKAVIPWIRRQAEMERRRIVAQLIRDNRARIRAIANRNRRRRFGQ